MSRAPQMFIKSVSVHSLGDNQMAARYASRYAAAADDVVVELLPFIRVYKSGRVERLIGNDTVPASLDGTSTGGVVSKDVTFTTETAYDPEVTASARLYFPTAAAGAGKKLPILVYFHGGGFMVESAASPKYHRYLNALAARAGAIVVSVDYRRAPEHPLPAAYDDSWAAFSWADRCSWGGGSDPDPWLAKHGDSSRVFVAGDSAGANIAQHVAMRAGQEFGPSIRGVLLMHPYFWDGSYSMGLQLEERVRNEWRVMTGRPDPSLHEAWLSPTADAAPRLASMPARSVLVAVAGKDFLAPKGRAYYAALLKSGWRGEAELVENPGVEHVFYLDQPETAAAQALMDRVVAFIDGCLGVY